VRKRIVATLVILITLLPAVLFAQAKTSLDLRCDQTGARVYIGDKLVGYTSPNFSTLILPGSYTIRVAKEGFPDFQTSVIVGQSPVTIIATLGWSRPPAPLPPMPQPPSPRSFPIYIDASNAARASLYRDSTLIGSLPYRGDWRPGVYSLRITAPGYGDYVDRIVLNAPLTMRINLPALYVDYEIKLPQFFATRDGRPFEFKDMDIYLDGQYLASPFGKTSAGTHRLIVFLRDLRFEADFELSAGKYAVIEPFLGIRIR
jgi:hypothetical protein